MLKAEEDEGMRERYKKDIAEFEKAYTVQKAINEFRSKHGHMPEVLDDLIPEFLSALPDLSSDVYYLEWEPPALRLKRQTPAKWGYVLVKPAN